jgi:hypothetical protein
VNTCLQVCREVDDFFINTARNMPSNKNQEIGGRDGVKFFKHGVTTYMLPKIRRINGGWWISIARHLRIFFCFTKLVSDATRHKFGKALSLLFVVHHALRDPVHKTELVTYQNNITTLLKTLIEISKPTCKSKCNSIKHHWGYHWGGTRQQLGCSANEKSLEQNLGEVQKKHFKHTNKRYSVEVNIHFLLLIRNLLVISCIGRTSLISIT